MNRILNIYNVNSTSGLKNYTSIIDGEAARKYFKETFPHVHFNKTEEVGKLQPKEEIPEPKQLKERELSFFERKVFKKYKHFYTMIE